MRGCLRTIGFTCAVLGLALGFAATAGARSWNVWPGDSIQAAVDKAKPGDRVLVHRGVYHQSVAIATDDIRLLGVGGRVVLDGSTGGSGTFCDAPGEVMGICVIGSFDESTGEPGAPVEDVAVRRFVVRNFSGFGVFWFNAHGITVTGSAAKRNGEYGISGFVASKIRLVNNRARGNGEPGFYIGDSPHANARVIGNVAVANGVGGPEGIGFLFRDASHGFVANNVARGNCAGMVFVDTGENPDPAGDWVAVNNHANRNNGSCTGEEGGGAPPLSGLGIVLFGTHDSRLVGNVVRRNVPSGPSVFSGGIVVASSAAIGGADPTDNRIRVNHAHLNSPFDILWDGSGSGNGFKNNSCEAGSPASLCD